MSHMQNPIFCSSLDSLICSTSAYQEDKGHGCFPTLVKAAASHHVYDFWSRRIESHPIK
ncbi:hypothetical protein MBANPS3_002943, partial [Mucor bainieri]